MVLFIYLLLPMPIGYVLCESIKFQITFKRAFLHSKVFRGWCICFWPHIFLKKMSHSRPYFLYFRLFNTVESKQFSIRISPMTGFEPQTSGIRSNHSTNWATTTAQVVLFVAFRSLIRFVKSIFKYLLNNLSPLAGD